MVAPRRRAGQAGFTLVELMVSLVLGLVLLIGVAGIFVTSRQSYTANENLARLQESARVSFELLVREIRESGSLPCGTRAVANVVRSAGSTPWWANWDDGPLRGYDGAQPSAMRAFGSSSATRVNATDGILILRTVSDESAVKMLLGHDPTTSTLRVPSAAGITADDVIAVCDSSSAALAVVQSTTAVDVKYDSPDNCSTNLGYPTGSCDGLTPVKTFGVGSIVAKFDPAFWYVGVNNRGGRSLYRQGKNKAEEMVPGVHDMQIEYLVRSASGIATNWVTASDVPFTATEAWTAANPSQAIAVRLTLVLRSDNNTNSSGKPLERKFVAVAALRSRDL